MKNVEYELDEAGNRTGGYRLSQFEPTPRLWSVPPSKRKNMSYTYPPNESQ